MSGWKCVEDGIGRPLYWESANGQERVYAEPPARDPIVEDVRADLLIRSARGLVKYGVGLDRDDIGLEGWLEHHYQELLDAALYVKRAILELRRQRRAEVD